VALATTFWETFFLILIFLPLAMIWAFALIDIFRRDDIGGFSKALWVAAVILVPFLGTLIYLITRPAGATQEERVMIDQASREFVARYSPDDTASQLQVLAELHDRGKLTDEEFAAEKARVLGTASGSTEPPATPGAPAPA
jgi:Phospholipase_D-nuclease N-terminal/Short C-terminal domain